MNTITTIKKRTKLKVRRRKLPKKVVSIRLDPKIHQQVDQLAKADKRSFSQFVELVLERYLRSAQQTDSPLLEQALTNTQHGFWSQIDAYEAAANLQTLLKERQV